jgi:hypothetical protein
MKQFLISIPALMLMAGSLLAQDVGGAQADMVKARAKQQRDINNQQQGITPAAPTTQPGPGTYQAPGSPSAPKPGINPAQQALIDRLETDLHVLKPGVPATPQNKTGLQTDIESLAKGADKPSKASTAKLAADLADALADKAVTAKDLALLAKVVNVVMNCAPYSPPRMQTFVSSAQTVLKSSGASDDSVKVIGADLTRIVMEIQKAKPKLYQ